MAVKGLRKCFSSSEFNFIEPYKLYTSGVYLHHEEIRLINIDSCDYTNLPHSVYHIMIVTNGSPNIRFTVIIIPKDGDITIKFIGMEESKMSDCNYKKDVISMELIKKFLDYQYRSMVRLSIQDTLSFDIYKDTREELKYVLEFFNKFVNYQPDLEPEPVPHHY